MVRCVKCRVLDYGLSMLLNRPWARRFHEALKRRFRLTRADSGLFPIVPEEVLTSGITSLDPDAYWPRPSSSSASTSKFRPPKALSLNGPRPLTWLREDVELSPKLSDVRSADAAIWLIGALFSRDCVRLGPLGFTCEAVELQAVLGFR